MLLDEREVRERVGRVEALLAEMEALEDPEARAKAAEMAGVLLELYGEALARMMEAVAASGDRERLFEAFAGDELVSHLLILHGLHPLGVEERVARALEEVRPYLESHGGDAVLLGVEEGVARIRLEGSCNGCPSSTATLKLAIEEAVMRAAPELERVEAEGASGPRPQPAFVGMPAPRRKRREASREEGSAWTELGKLPVPPGGTLVREVAGERVLFAAAGGSLYAYRDLCPGCGGPLERGELEGDVLSCPGCSRRYSVRRAGRCLDGEELHLEPVPLLEGGGGVRVAVAGGV